MLGALAVVGAALVLALLGSVAIRPPSDPT